MLPRIVDSLSRRLNQDALVDLEGMDVYDDVWLALGACMVLGGSPATLGAGCSVMDNKSGSTIRVVSRQLDASSGQVC